MFYWDDRGVGHPVSIVALHKFIPQRLSSAPRMHR